MNRRDLLKLVGGSAIAATLPKAEAPVRIQRRASDKVFMHLTAPKNIKPGDMVSVAGMAMGVAILPARRGETVMVQVYGPYEAHP